MVRRALPQQPLTFNQPTSGRIFGSRDRNAPVDVGGNGQGKTTLLKLINGDETLTSGMMELAPGCEIGYFHQDHATLDFNLNPVEQIQNLRPDFQYGDIRAALGRFQFSNEQVSTKLSQLLGGERVRVALLKLLLEETTSY